MKRMDELLDFMLAVFMAIIACIPAIVVGWFIYRICAGAYHLLDKLIDKI